MEGADAGSPADVARARALAFAQHVAPTLLGVARRAVDLAELEEEHAVLDVAAATGLAAFLAAERVGRDGTVVALDESAAMLEVAQERSVAAGYDYIRWQEGSAAPLGFADESFDALLCLQSFLHFPRPDAVVQEFRRVLVEDGRLVLTCWGTRVDNEWIDLVERALRQSLPAPPARPFALLQPSNLEVLLQAAGLEQIELGRVADRLRFRDQDGLWQWALASREWGPLLTALPPEAQAKTQTALAAAMATRHRGGEYQVKREIVYARAIAPASP